MNMGTPVTYGKTLAAWFVDNPDKPATEEFLAGMANVGISRVHDWCRARAAARKGKRLGSLTEYQPINGNLHAVNINEWVYHPATRRRATAAQTPATTATAASPADGSLLEVVRTLKSGRIMLECEDGRLFLGRLTEVES